MSETNTAMPTTEVKRARQWLEFVRVHRFAVLLAALMLMFFYGPIVQLFAEHVRAVAARVGIGVAFSLLLITAVFSVSRDRRVFRRMLCIAVPTVVCGVLDMALFRAETHVISHIFGSIFLIYVIAVLLKFIFVGERVTEDTICASLCVYLLLAILWALGYSLVELYEPDAFWYLKGETWENRAMRFGAEPAGLEFYYSIVTMTTLGYGDIVPVKSASRALASLQAVVGQLYLAVLVARLVGLHVAESAGRKE